ncbi:unnamed protein product [Cuscuta epithymum]|uniref:Uncharacterized protein n=1 Tax=Cuscuta epithymum TaxID=186058 RepID=A0AAV0FYR4_9ASTE|nr:unnamed protein product [Cuscuta epithymum]
MQARLSTAAAAMAKLNRPMFFMIPKNQYFLPQRFVSASVGRTADPNVHAGDLDGDNAAEVKKAETAKGESEIKPPGIGKSPFSSSKSPCGSTPKIGSTGVSDPVEPNLQQKRRNSDAAKAEPLIADVSCTGLDGGPWPDEATDRRHQEEDDKEFFKHHKASPLSEIKLADTRKPVSRATDSGGGGAADGVVTWRPEQLDTAEGSLLRAMEVWKWNAMRGDPDSPHGKVLRELKGENW